MSENNDGIFVFAVLHQFVNRMITYRSCRDIAIRDSNLTANLDTHVRRYVDLWTDDLSIFFCAPRRNAHFTVNVVKVKNVDGMAQYPAFLRPPRNIPYRQTVAVYIRLMEHQNSASNIATGSDTPSTAGYSDELSDRFSDVTNQT